jgi:hypothetical protein
MWPSDSTPKRKAVSDQRLCTPEVDAESDAAPIRFRKFDSEIMTMTMQAKSIHELEEFEGPAVNLWYEVAGAFARVANSESNQLFKRWVCDRLCCVFAKLA